MCSLVEMCLLWEPRPQHPADPLSCMQLLSCGCHVTYTWGSPQSPASSPPYVYLLPAPEALEFATPGLERDHGPAPLPSSPSEVSASVAPFFLSEDISWASHLGETFLFVLFLLSLPDISCFILTVSLACPILWALL